MGYCIEINLTFLGMGYIFLMFGLVREYWDSALREERILGQCIERGENNGTVH
jgi:hypothetical protein